LSHNSLRFVFQDKENHLWVGSSGGGLMQFQEPRFSSYGIERNLTEPLVKSLSSDPNGNIFAATFGGGIQALIGNDFQSFPSDEEEGNFPQSILVDTDQRIWAGTYEHGLFLKARNSATFALQKNVDALTLDPFFKIQAALFGLEPKISFTDFQTILGTH
jgi:ligand-binding sensor domain-containing protein